MLTFFETTAFTRQITELLDDAIYMLLAYSKDERDDLTAAQKRTLKKLVTEDFG